jgi:hypothetical protein
MGNAHAARGGGIASPRCGNVLFRQAEGIRLRQAVFDVQVEFP